MFEGLPLCCYSTDRCTGEIIILKKGESGYCNLDYKELRTADELNEELGVTKGQAKAMEFGSMWGWDVLGSNPLRYDENGNPKREVVEVVTGEEVVKSLVDGNIIIWNNPQHLIEPRYYRYKNNKIEYSDNKVNWIKSSMEIESFNDREIEWVIDK